MEQISINPQTLCQMFYQQCEELEFSNAIGWIEGDKIRFYNFYQYRDIVETLSLAFFSLGIKTADRIAILSNTCKEWHLIDMAGLCSRACVVPIYHTYTPAEIEFIYNHAECRALIVQDEQQFKKILKVQDRLNNLISVISFHEISEELLEQLSKSVRYYHWQELIEVGKKEKEKHPDAFLLSIKAQRPSDWASIIYTSGTTGLPKGAIINHGALFQMLKNVKMMSKNSFTRKDRTLTWLPLSHVFGRVDSMIPAVFGCEAVYCESIEKLIPSLELVKPTLMCAVPRIFEKIYEKIMSQISDSSMVKKALFDWALKVSNQYHQILQDDLTPSAFLIGQHQLAYQLVWSKVYNRFGGKIRYFISGGAPLSADIVRFLRNANLTVLEGYGLTETIGPCTINPLSKQNPGEVGKPMGDVEITFSQEGEILIRTIAMFEGYYKNEEATADAIDSEGWFHSGDIGEFTTEGYLKITDRKKDIIITSGGKNVAPQKIENLMKLQPLISHFVVIGDQKKFLTGLVGIEKANFSQYFEILNLDKSCSFKELANSPGIKNLIMKNVIEVNKNLAQFETIKDILIVPEELSIENGFLTPSLKVKKKALADSYFEQVDAMYKKHEA